MAQERVVTPCQRCSCHRPSPPRGRLSGEPTARGLPLQQRLRRRIGYNGVRVGESRLPAPRTPKSDRAYSGVTILNGSGLGTPMRLLAAVRSNFVVVPEHRVLAGAIQSTRD